ncbi:hypothetical protein [Flagellimonas sp.]|uniref:hypothetical protein n=1 Tax=Flagellimonas sp. TaxID=2058762 RepID=UPI003B527241
MKNTLVILSLLLLSASCNQKKPIRKEMVTQYYQAFEEGNYQKIKALINDTLTITSGDYVTPYTHESFYEFFKWDSIFKTSYDIVQLDEVDNKVIVNVASESVRYKFLKNNPLTCQFNISFDSGKISKIESGECAGADWGIWQKERDSLVSWIQKNHPKLDGFIHDMTMDGAINYVKAIELYVAEP